MRKMWNVFLAVAMIAATVFFVGCGDFGSDIAAAGRKIIGLKDYSIKVGDLISQDKNKSCDIDLRSAFSPQFDVFVSLVADKQHDFSSSPDDLFLVKIECMMLLHKDLTLPESQIPMFASFYVEPFADRVDSNRVEVTYKDNSIRSFTGLKNFSISVKDDKGVVIYGVKPIIQRFGLTEREPRICN